MTSVATTPKTKQLSEAGLASFKNFFGASTPWPVLLASDLQSFLFGNLPGVVGYGARSLTLPIAGRFPQLFKRNG